MTSLLLPLLLSQWLSQGMRVNDEGAVQGYARSVDCVGTGVTCSSDGFVWTIDVAGGTPAPTTAQYWTGAADATLTAEHNLGALSTGIVVNNAGTPQIMGAAACTLPNVVTGYSATGVATCGQPSNVTGSSASTTGNAATATALAANPSDCASDRYATTIAANGNLTCAQVSVAGLSATGTPSSSTFLRGDGAWSVATASSVDNITPVTPPTGGAACSPSGKVVIDTNGKWWACDAGTWFSTAWGQAEQAIHLAANGTNCSSGQVPLGMDTYGNAEGCYTGPADVVAVPIVTTAATSVLSNEQVLPTCTSGDVLTFNGTAISCTTPGAGPSGPARTTTTGAYSNTSNTVWSTVMTISGLSASTRYEIHCNLREYADATTTGIRLRLNSSGTMTSMAVKFEKCSSTTAVRTVTVTALTTSTDDTASAGTTICLDTIDGFFTTNTATDLRIEGVSEINLSGVYIDVGSSCTVEAY